MKLILPYPVSSNRYWRSFSYMDKAEAGWRAKAAGLRAPLAGPVEVLAYEMPMELVIAA